MIFQAVGIRELLLTVLAPGILGRFVVAAVDDTGFTYEDPPTTDTRHRDT